MSTAKVNKIIASLRAASAPAAVREMTIQECAKLVEQSDLWSNNGEIAKAIRALATPEEAFTAAGTEEQFEERLLKQEAGENLRLLDYIADKIGLPHNEELSRENFGAWLASTAEGEAERSDELQYLRDLASNVVREYPVASGLWRDSDGQAGYGSLKAIRIFLGLVPSDKFASPPAAQTDGVREIAADAIRTFCKSLGSSAVQMSHGEERIYYSGISLDALAGAVALALTRPHSNTPETP